VGDADEIVLALEPCVDGADGYAGARADISQREFVVAPLLKQGQGRLDRLFERLAAPGLLGLAGLEVRKRHNVILQMMPLSAAFRDTRSSHSPERTVQRDAAGSQRRNPSGSTAIWASHVAPAATSTAANPISRKPVSPAALP
jgi:hypothetical protein